ncbi:MAG: hypothetical protein ABFD61_03845 [Chloroherpetonaceae bacterium]
MYTLTDLAQWIVALVAAISMFATIIIKFTNMNKAIEELQESVFDAQTDLKTVIESLAKIGINSIKQKKTIENSKQKL